jgi:hypothetical protein
MARKGKITDLFDLEKIRAQKAEVQGYLKEFVQDVGRVKPIRVQLAGAEKTKEIFKGVTELSLAVKQYEKLQKDVAVGQARLNALESEHAKKLAEVRAISQQRNKELKDEALLQKSVANSIEEAKAKISLLTAERNKLNLNTLEGKKRQAELNTELDRYNKFISDNVDKQEKQRRSIGNYSGALKILEGELTNIRRKLDDYTKSGKVSADVIAQLRKEEALLNQLVNNQVNGFASATQELRNNEKALQALQAAGQESSEFYQQLLGETARLKDNVSDLKTEIKNLGSDTRTIEGLVGSAQLLAGTYAVAVESAKLFGVESDQLAEAQQKSQAIIAVLTGLQAIHNALQKESATILFLQTARTKALAVAQTIFSAAVGTSTGAMRAFRIALLASGIGVVLLLLPLLVKGVESLTSSTKKSEEQLKAHSEALKEGNALLKERQELINNVANDQIDALNREIDLLSASGNKTQEVFNLRKRVAQLQKEQAQETLKNFGLTENKLVSLETKLSLINDKLLTAQDIKLKAIDENDERAIKAAETNIERLTSAFTLYKEQLDTGRAAVKQMADATSELSKIEIDRTQFQIENNKRARKAIFDDLKASIEDQIEEYKKIADTENISLTSRLEARQQVQELQERLIIAERDFTLSQEQLLADEIKTINNKANRDIVKSKQSLAEDLGKIFNQVKQLQKEAFAADLELGADLKTREQLLEESIKTEEDAFVKRQAFLEEGRDIAIASYERERVAKLKVAQSEGERQKIEAAYQDQRKAKEIETDRLILEAAIELAKEKLKLITDPAQRAGLEAQIASAKRALEELGKTEVDIKTEKASKKMERLGNQIQEIGGKVLEVFDAIGEVIAGNIDRKKNEIEEEIILIEKRRDKELEAIERSTLSEQDKAAKVELLNTRTQFQKEQLERRQRQLDIERARFEKARAIGQIILNTAQAVTAALTSIPPNVPLSIVVGVIGAIRLAAAIAAPLPKFKDGKNLTNKNTYEGLAWVGDGGRSELHVKENGDMEITPNTPTVTWVGKKDVIYPDAEVALSKALRGRTYERIRQSGQQKESERISMKKVEKKLDVIAEAIKNKPVSRFVNTYRGIQGGYESAKRFVTYVKDQTNW